MYFDRRKSGLSLIDDLPWGSHFCQLYHTREDLLEIIVPYLGAGLKDNEFCLWVTDDLLSVEDATEALKKAVPGFETCARRGQVEIISRRHWQAGGGELGPAVLARLDEAVSRGFDGLRLACHAPPQEMPGRNARDGADALCRYNVIAVFAYPRDQVDAIGLMAVVQKHRLALVKNAGRWEVIESSEARSMREDLRRSEEKLHSVFANMSEGYAYNRIVLDPQGVPCDFVFLEVNEAFERQTGLPHEDLIGRRATQVLPGLEKDPADWIGTYGRVALSGEPVQFENYSQTLGRWYAVSAFSPHRGFFAVTFSDITERKATEEAMRRANERLQNQAEELQAQAEELQTQTEELNAQAHELRTVNDELQRSEQALRVSEQRVRLKLDSILSPQGDLGTLELADIIDTEAIQSLMEDFYALTRIPMSIVDRKGRVLVGVGWQEVCTKFHRAHPQACRYCLESDTQLTAGIVPGECRLYQCKNHMWDIATPLLVAGHPMGNLFSGQFFFEDEPLDRELFLAQARRYGFDEPAYLAALEAVPRLSRAAVNTGMAFLTKLARMLARLGYSNVELARSLEERKFLLESVHQGQERLNRAQEIAHLGSWELDVERNELTWSDEVYRIFGLPPQEFSATYEAFLAHVHPDDRAAVDAAYTGSLRENRDRYEIEHRVVRRDTGEVRIVHEKCRHLRDAAGRIVRSAGMVHDITDRKRLEAELRRLNSRLEEQVQARTKELKATVARLREEVGRRVLAEDGLRQRSCLLEQRAHQLQKLTLELSQAEDRERKRLAEILHDDLQQQLAAAKFHLSLLGNRLPRDPAIRDGLSQLEQILKDSIEISRSLSHELSPAVLYHGNLGEAFEWLAQRFKTKHGLAVYVESRDRIDSASDPLKVFLFKAAQEILFNVVKHARVPEARLRLQRVRGHVYLTISDQGQGFDPRALSRAGGFGLLSIRERIELLGGRMRIRSAPGRGSTFLIAVPDGTKPQDTRQTREDSGHKTSDGTQPSSALDPASSALRVLLVDDHKITRQGVAALVSEQPDLEVVGEAGNGREAVHLACQLRPDVVVMDVAMPVMGGEEATRQIKRQWPKARIVALSMFDGAELAKVMREAGAEAYLLKTAPSEELLAAIRGGPLLAQAHADVPSSGSPDT